VAKEGDGWLRWYRACLLAALWVRIIQKIVDNSKEGYEQKNAVKYWRTL
jgi:hypothetical protein